MLRFAILAKVMLAFVIIPISNAASERAFSMVRKIETDFRLLLLVKKSVMNVNTSSFSYFPTNMFSAEYVRPSIILLFKGI